jgi:hypothetical protein
VRSCRLATPSWVWCGCTATTPPQTAGWGPPGPLLSRCWRGRGRSCGSPGRGGSQRMRLRRPAAKATAGSGGTRCGCTCPVGVVLLQQQEGLAPARSSCSPLARTVYGLGRGWTSMGWLPGSEAGLRLMQAPQRCMHPLGNGVDSRDICVLIIWMCVQSGGQSAWCHLGVRGGAQVRDGTSHPARSV